MKTEIDVILLDAAGTIFAEEPSSPGGVAIYDDAHDLLDALEKRRVGQRRVKTGIVTNWGRRIHRVLQTHDLTNHFDVVVTVDDVASGKPSPEPFLLACNTLQIQPACALFVGDSLQGDAFGAHDAGLQALWLNRRRVLLEGELARMVGLLPHPSCRDLAEVQRYLEQLFREKCP